MGTALRNDIVMDFADFDALLANRPDWERWELIDGVAIMMNPPYQRHQVIAQNITFELERIARDSDADWYPYAAVGVRDPAQTHRTTIPDVLVRRGPLVEESPYCGDPIVIVEIVSRSSVTIDRRWKLGFYSRIPTMRHYLVLRQDRLLVEAYHKAGDWEAERRTAPEERVELGEIDVSLSLRDIYRRTGLLPD